jgi:hypothetical protein
MTGIFGILESSAKQWYQDVAPTQEFCFHRHIYSLWVTLLVALRLTATHYHEITDVPKHTLFNDQNSTFPLDKYNESSRQLWTFLVMLSWFAWANWAYVQEHFQGCVKHVTHRYIINSHPITHSFHHDDFLNRPMKPASRTFARANI